MQSKCRGGWLSVIYSNSLLVSFSYAKLGLLLLPLDGCTVVLILRFLPYEKREKSYYN